MKNDRTAAHKQLIHIMNSPGVTEKVQAAERFAEYKIKCWKTVLFVLAIVSACVYGGVYSKFVRRVG
jgi:hypothetical protein